MKEEEFKRQILELTGALDKALSELRETKRIVDLASQEIDFYTLKGKKSGKRYGGRSVSATNRF